MHGCPKKLPNLTLKNLQKVVVFQKIRLRRISETIFNIFSACLRRARATTCNLKSFEVTKFSSQKNLKVKNCSKNFFRKNFLYKSESHPALFVRPSEFAYVCRSSKFFPLSEKYLVSSLLNCLFHSLIN